MKPPRLQGLEPGEGPLWVYGVIDSNANIEWRSADCGDFSSHPLTVTGHRWRFNVRTQEWAAPRGHSELTEGEYFAVKELLIKEGFMVDYLALRQQEASK